MKKEVQAKVHDGRLTIKAYLYFPYFVSIYCNKEVIAENTLKSTYRKELIYRLLHKLCVSSQIGLSWKAGRSVQNKEKILHGKIVNIFQERRGKRGDVVQSTEKEKNKRENLLGSEIYKRNVTEKSDENLEMAWWLG